MTDDLIIRTIAEDLGWRLAFPEHGEPHPQTRRGGILLPYKWINEKDNRRVQELPNYLDEKNPGPAHELIEVLRGEGWELSIITWGTDNWQIQASKDGSTITSADPSFCRAVCECFLKVKGKWKEAQP